MLKSVRLENFRGFAALKLALAPVSVIVGPNSCGKTTVLHAISAAHRAYAHALELSDAHPVVEDRWVKVCDGVILQSHTRLLPIAVQEEIFRNGEASDGTWTEIELGFDERDPVRGLFVKLAYMRNKVLKLSVQVECPAALAAVEEIGRAHV